MADIFTEEQRTAMDDAMALRMVGISHLKKKWENDDPTIGEMRVGNELAGGVETSIITEIKTAHIINKEQADSADIGMIAGMLKEISLQNAQNNEIDTTPRELDVPDELLSDFELVPGQTDSSIVHIELSEIIGDEDDEEEL